MYHQATKLFHAKFHTSDGEEMGSVHDFYFDRQDWIVRYVVADIGAWLFGRRVLIGTAALGSPRWDKALLPVNLTKAQVKESPDIDLEQPVTRQQETRLLRYYDWPNYWGMPGTVGMGGAMVPAIDPRVDVGEDLPAEVMEGLQNAEESQITSMRDTEGYTLEGVDGGIGAVADFIVDDQDWSIPYLVVDTSSWRSGRPLLLPPSLVQSVDWHEGRVYTDMNLSRIEQLSRLDELDHLAVR